MYSFGLMETCFYDQAMKEAMEVSSPALITVCRSTVGIIRVGWSDRSVLLCQFNSASNLLLNTNNRQLSEP